VEVGDGKVRVVRVNRESSGKSAHGPHLAKEEEVALYMSRSLTLNLDIRLVDLLD
jgi:hypothetical protein